MVMMMSDQYVSKMLANPNTTNPTTTHPHQQHHPDMCVCVCVLSLSLSCTWHVSRRIAPENTIHTVRSRHVARPIEPNYTIIYLLCAMFNNNNKIPQHLNCVILI